MTEGLKVEGSLLLNIAKSLEEIGFNKRGGIKIYTFDATGIAMNILKRPITNTIMLGALIAITGIVSLDSIKKVIQETFEASVAELNIKAVEVAYEEMKE